MRINQNIAAYNSFRNLSATNTQLGKSLEKLSSGFRINRAADDAAGLAKSESLRAEIRGSRQAIRNAQDGVSFVQTAEGALNEVHSILQRMRELAVDAANTATTDGVAQQAEVTQLLAELTAIGTNSTFAGKSVFANYSAAALTFHVGSGAGQTLGQMAEHIRGLDVDALHPNRKQGLLARLLYLIRVPGEAAGTVSLQHWLYRFRREQATTKASVEFVEVEPGLAVVVLEQHAAGQVRAVVASVAATHGVLL